MVWLRRIVIVAVAALITLLSCAKNPAIDLRYKAEKMYYQVEKARKKLQNESKQPSSPEYGRLLNSYSEVINFSFAALDSIDPAVYPTEHNELKYLTHKASWQQARLQLSAGLFDSSVATLNRLITEIQQDDTQLLNTCFQLGQTLQAAGRWDSALTVYNFTIEEFYPPLDNTGEIIAPAFNMPIRLYHIVSVMGDTATAAREFKRAEQYYRKLIDDYPSTKLASAGHLALADLYDETRQWNKEIDQLSAITDPGAPGYTNNALRMADILGGRLRQYDTAHAIYNNVLTGLSPQDSTLKPAISLKIALLRLEQKQYGQVRDAIAGLKEDYPIFFDSTPVPQYTLARSLDLEGKWERAESEYSLLIEKYSGTDEAMMAHLHMLDHLRQEGREVEAQGWFRSAAKHFDDAAYRGRGTAAEAKALFYKAELYRRSDESDLAAEILVSVFSKFPTTEPGRRALMAAADLYRNTLNNPAKADSLLTHMRRYLPNVAGVVENKDLLTD